MEKKSNGKFIYLYSVPTATERTEIENIRNRYTGKTEEKSKLERLRELDGRAKNPPLILGLFLGIIGTLIFGLGLTMILEWKIYVWGVGVAVIGCVPAVLAYPMHNLLLKRNKQKYGAEIVRLSDELLNETEEKE